MSTGNDSILDAFLYETNSLLEQLDSIVLAAEQADDFSQEDINSIFRIMHTVKGASAMMEFTSLMKIAHRAEDMFAIIREKSLDIVPVDMRPELFDMLFQCIDFFREETQRIENSEPLTEDIDSLLQKVNSFIDSIQNPSAQNKKPEQSENSNAAQNSANFACGLRVFFEEGCGMEHVRANMVLTAVSDICEDDTYALEPENISDASVCPEIIANGLLIKLKNESDRANVVISVQSIPSVDTYELIDNVAEQKERAQEVQEPKEEVEIVPEKAEEAKEKKPAPEKPVAAKPAPARSEGGQKESLISVNLSKLDQLAAVVGEIVITESMVTASPELKGMQLDAFTKSARQLRKLTDELQDVSMSLRMVPVSATFQKMNRIVRDMCKKLNKQAKLVLVGELTEVDKTIVDTIGDPIMHIVRNSMDHGIEKTPEDRKAAGKDPTAQIILSAHNTGSEVIIEIKDDGKGVDCDAVLKKAIKNGIVSESETYSEKEILQLLMAPGFSTNAQVTEFSGRGVGMDVVRQNVENVGGTVTISSEWGKGMTTTLKIPLTMSIMDAMEVSVGNSVFTIPIQNIRQSFRIGEEDIIRDAKGGEMFKIMGNFYPVVRMRDALCIQEGFTQIKDGILMWVDSGDVSYCLFVDELLGEQQVVVKPIPAYLSIFNIKRRGIVGCTILGDGSISLILDIAQLLK